MRNVKHFHIINSPKDNVMSVVLWSRVRCNTYTTPCLLFVLVN